MQAHLESDTGAIERLVEIALENHGNEQRSETRHPFFRHATIINDSDRATWRHVFTRDISPQGMGLLHDFLLDGGPVVLTVDGGPKPLLLDIRWCRPCGRGWYISGGSFR